MNLSLNLTIHNKGYLLPRVLENIRQYTSGSYELVMVLDGCTDDSQQIAETFCKENPKIKSKIIVADNVFETKANNLAAKESTGDHIIIIQDDMIIMEPFWNMRLLMPFKIYSDIFAVTGNTSHNWEINPNSIDVASEVIHNDKWSDILNHVHHANRMNMPRDIFAIRDCVNRGPLAISKADLETMNYFDEAFAPLDMDDHDLCFRMHKKLGKEVGSLWIDWYSKPEHGGTRDEDGKTRPWAFEAQNKNTRLVYERHKDYISTQKVENRIIKLYS